MEKIILDEQEVTQEQLQEAKKNEAVRIIEVSANEYKTLKKLNSNNEE